MNFYSLVADMAVLAQMLQIESAIKPDVCHYSLLYLSLLCTRQLS